jgi:hypothetical protein
LDQAAKDGLHSTNSASHELTGDISRKRHAALTFVAAAALLFLCVLNWLTVLPLLRSRPPGAQDFSIFYIGSRIVLDGDSSHLYDLYVQARYHTSVYQSQPLPFNHPAYELILFLPLAAMSFYRAYLFWVALNVILAAFLSVLLSRHLSVFPKPASLWTFALAMASFPLVWTLCQGQDSILLLFIFVLTYLSLKSGNDLLAGMILAAGLFKFTLVVPFFIPFLLKRRWRFVAGFFAGSAALAEISVSMTGIAGARQYLQLLAMLAAHPSSGYINPLMMPDARGFLFTVLLGHRIHRQTFEIVVAVVSVLLLLVPLLTFVRRPQSERFDSWFALNLAIAMLVSPHLYWHDLTLLLLPISLAANSLLKTGIPSRFTLLVAIVWCTLYLSPLPIYLASLEIHQSIYFLPLCLFVFWLVRGIKLLPTNQLTEPLTELPG